MNETTTTSSNLFVLRRFVEPFNLFGLDLPGWIWGLLLGVVLAAALVYVVLMYIKDSRGVGLLWASVLGILRMLVYVVLGFCFLLPSCQTIETTEDRSMVRAFLDVSGSFTDTKDDLPEEGKSFDALPTRADKLIAFLQKNAVEHNKKLLDTEAGRDRALQVLRQNQGEFLHHLKQKGRDVQAEVDEKGAAPVFRGLIDTDPERVIAFLEKRNPAFLSDLLDKNPVTLYRFAARTDENFLHLTRSQGWTREELDAFVREPDATRRAEAPLPPFEYLTAWLKPTAKQDAPPEWTDTQKQRLAKLQDANAKLADAGMFNSTNVIETVTAALNRDLNKMVQGIIVITDGRHTSPVSPAALLQLEERARTAKIPIFVIVVGTERPQVRIDVADLRLPKTIRPEDSFRAVVEVSGEGLPDQPCKVELDVARVRRTKDGKEELVDLVLVGASSKAPKDAKKEELSLGAQVLTLQPVEPVNFDRGTPPRATAEFQIDAAALARAAGKALEPDKKWEIAEARRESGGEGDALVFQARLAVDRREIYPGVLAKDVLKVMGSIKPVDREKYLPWHVIEKSSLQVIRKPLEILLFTSGALRDFQFVRTLMYREMEKDRVGLSIYLQNPPGVTERRKGIVLDVPAKRMLDKFPENFDQPADDEEKKLNDLASYDVIVAFDPDWRELTDKQLDNVQKWVDRGGGLIVVGGPINTLELARPGAAKDKLKPILDLYPVVLRDVRTEDIDRKPDKPWPLTFEGASPDMEFLKLSDKVDQGQEPFLSDWKEFWGTNTSNPDKTAVQRGFFNYYPVDQAKAGAMVVARFADPQAKDKDGKQMPFIVTTAEGSGRRVVWLAAGEMWRLRMYKETFHERFWTKLARYAGSANQGKSTKRISPFMSRRGLTNRYLTIEARIDGKGGEPLGPRAKEPEVTVKVPPGVNAKEIATEFKLAPNPGSIGWWTAKALFRSPGNYDIEIRVPETKDSHTERVTIDQANPELDDTKPDFDTMYRMASEADLVFARVRANDPAAYEELRRRLVRPALADVKLEGKGKEENDDKPRLYFTLDNADLIPSCMITDVQKANINGPYNDLWDRTLPLWIVLLGLAGVLSITQMTLVIFAIVQAVRRQPWVALAIWAGVVCLVGALAVGGFVLDLARPEHVAISIVLLVAIGLLSLEWLIRKLLRLA